MVQDRAVLTMADW